jgi:hypothetical protein
MSDQRTDLRPSRAELESLTAELLSERAAMTILRLPAGFGMPVLPIGGGDTIEPPPIPTDGVPTDST